MKTETRQHLASARIDAAQLRREINQDPSSCSQENTEAVALRVNVSLWEKIQSMDSERERFQIL